MDDPLIWLHRQGGLSGAWYAVSPPFDGLEDDDLVIGLWSDEEDLQSGEWRERSVARAKEITGESVAPSAAADDG